MFRHSRFIVTAVFFFFIPRMFESFRSHYSMNSELTESSLLILSIVSARRLATLS
jgi:hypothetical protein